MYWDADKLFTDDGTEVIHVGGGTGGDGEYRDQRHSMRTGAIEQRLAQAHQIAEALEYGTDEVLFDGWLLIRAILIEAVEGIDATVLSQLESKLKKKMVDNEPEDD